MSAIQNTKAAAELARTLRVREGLSMARREAQSGMESALDGWRAAHLGGAIDLTRAAIAEATLAVHRQTLERLDQQLSQSEREVDRATAALHGVQARQEGVNDRLRSEISAASLRRDDGAAGRFLDRFRPTGGRR